MLKGYRKIDKYLTDWCKKNGFNVKCRLDTDFSYEEDTKTIYYALVIPQAHDELFYDICKTFMPDVEKCDNFLLSFFHELGHHQTQDYFFDEEMYDYFDFLDTFDNKKKLTKKDYKRYYYHPVEISATEWGCTYINNNLIKIKDFFDGLVPLIMNFYKVNKVELD